LPVTGRSTLNIEQAVQCLQQGRLISYPTEAVFGLGCDPCNENAVRRLLALKDRPVSAGLILVADNVDRFAPFIKPLRDELKARALSAWPGPVTWLVPRADSVPYWLAGDHPTVALRIPDHPVCAALCAAFDGPIVSTSANPRSAEPARSPGEVEAYFGASLCGVVAGALGKDDNPSEIRDLISEKVLRKG
jgi:L-threonylcarbamoyladenylate synthase